LSKLRKKESRKARNFELSLDLPIISKDDSTGDVASFSTQLEISDLGVTGTMTNHGDRSVDRQQTGGDRNKYENGAKTVESVNVFFYVPNIIGYFRFSLVVISWLCHAFSRPNWTLCFYVIAAVLDFFDGYAARRLNQSSVFGAWLDVCIDVVARTMMWNMIFSPHLLSVSSSSSMLTCFPWGQLIGALEWLAFVCNHSAHGSRWKTRLIKDSVAPSSTSLGSSPPPWVTHCFANGFKSPLGFLAIAGVHGLPPWLYGSVIAAFGQEQDALWPCFSALLEYNFVVLPFLVCGRIYAACVETWLILDHVRFLSMLKEN